MSIDQSGAGSEAAGDLSSDGYSESNDQGGDAAAFDYKEAFRSQQRQVQETKGALYALRRESTQYRERTQQDLETVGRMREVFNPKEPTGPDPVAEWESQLDYYLAEGLKAEKQGRPMPLTVNLGVSHFQTLIAQHKERQQYAAEMAQMKAQLAEMRDPQQQINNTAYSALDSEIKRGLDSLYGPGATNIGQKRALFQAVSSQIVPYLERLQKTEPQKWDMIRRDPAELREIAQKALRGTVPPKALAMLAEDNLRNTVMPISELREALNEAKTIKDPMERKDTMDQIRQQIFQQMYANGRLGKNRG